MILRGKKDAAQARQARVNSLTFFQRRLIASADISTFAALAFKGVLGFQNAQMRLPRAGSHPHIRRRTLVKIFMADAANKYPENVNGKYYVDNQCIDCDLCRETAPDNFKRNEDGGYSYVFKQPESPDEEGRCKEAKEGCPVEAIGDNAA